MDEQGSQSRTRAIWVTIVSSVVAAVGLVVMLLLGSSSSNQNQTIPLSQLAHEVKNGEIKSLEVSDDRVLAVTTTGQRFTTLLGHANLFAALRELGVTSEGLSAIGSVTEDAPPTSIGFGALTSLLFAAFLGASLLILRGQRSSLDERLMSFGKSRARRVPFSAATTRFQDVAGVDEAKQELQEIVEFLKDRSKFAVVGARIPRGVLLSGPPGTGKTLLARAVAGEAGVPFFSINGSEFVEMIVGVGASRARDLFERAKRNAPCILFIDEIDAVGRQRGAATAIANQEREQTLNQILVEMDGFEPDTGVVVIAATNRPDVLDLALLRPGRFDRQVMLPRPDILGRRQILEVHARVRPVEASVDLMTIASETAGFTGADLANLVNEAAVLAVRRKKRMIGMAELEDAVDRVTAGAGRRTQRLNTHEKQFRAYREAGRAVVMRYLPLSGSVRKISVVSERPATGFTLYLGLYEYHQTTRCELKAILAAMLAGYAAEQVIFGETSSGPEHDIQKATSIARDMVERYGMSERLGTVAFARDDKSLLPPSYSEKTVGSIDVEIRRIIDEAYRQAASIIIVHRDVLDRVAHALLEHGTLQGKELESLF
jgi:cell division protease FtsH